MEVMTLSDAEKIAIQRSREVGRTFVATDDATVLRRFNYAITIAEGMEIIANELKVSMDEAYVSVSLDEEVFEF